MAANRPPRHDSRPPRRAVQAPDRPGDHLASRCHGDRSRPAVPRGPRDRQRDREERPARADGHRRALRHRRPPEPRNERGADVLHGLDRRADPGRPPKHALPPPAAALARLLRAQPRGRDHQPADERRRGSRPARHRRRHDARPEHALPLRDGDHPLLPRLAARSRDPDHLAADDGGDGDLPCALGPRLPGRPGAARPRHRDARRGHQRDAGRPDLPARARERAELPRRQRPLPRGEPGDASS